MSKESIDDFIDGLYELRPWESSSNWTAVETYCRNWLTTERTAREQAEGALRNTDENYRRQLESLGLLGRFAPGAHIADDMGEALLSAEARLADTEEGRLVEYNRARMYDLALSAALANPDSAADAAQHVIDTYRWVGEDAPRVQALQARLAAVEEALRRVAEATPASMHTLWTCKQIARAALALGD